MLACQAIPTQPSKNSFHNTEDFSLIRMTKITYFYMNMFQDNFGFVNSTTSNYTIESMSNRACQLLVKAVH